MELKQENGVFAYLKHYQSFQTVEDMDLAVKNHVYDNVNKLTLSERRVLYTLSRHALRYTGACHIKAATIAKELGVSDKTVYRALKKLADLHVITKHEFKKANGIKGASIYQIRPHIGTPNVHTCPDAIVQTQMSNRDNTKNTHCNNDSQIDFQKQSVISFNEFSFNQSFVNKNVNVYGTHTIHSDLKEQLRAIYNPQCVEGNQAFEELCKIAFGRLKQYMRSHNVPYLQMEQIVLKCMSDLVRKKNVRNQFAMYSKMIERQTMQLFETFLQPKMAAGVNMYGKKVGVVPDWFVPVGERKENVRNEPTELGIDFEAERKKMLARLGR